MNNIYKKRITAFKTVYPIAVIIVGSKLIQYLFLKIDQHLNDETSYIISSAVYGLFAGMNNFFKNYRRKRFF